MTIKILQLPLGPLQTNCYVLACEATKKAAVIDPSDSGQLIADTVAKNGWDVSHILLTHSHFDHVGGLAALKEATGAPIYIHPDAVQMLALAATSAARWQIPMDQPPEADQMVQEGDIIEVGQQKLEVLFTPGHAPGHVCFYLREHDVLFDGDVLFQQSIGRTDLPGGDFNLLMESISNKVMVLPDNTHVLSGHGPATSIGQERQWNPFLQ
ncbi:MAG: MBL fold metallo-hydrolase [Chloroflexota bacterium]